jgi:HEAT repeat protein
MSDGDEEPEQEAEESAAEATELDVETVSSRLDDAADALEAAETESDLDAVAEQLDAVESDLEAAERPEPAEDEEDAEDPAAAVEARLDELRDDLETQRGPYGSDVVAAIETAEETIADTEWTDQGIAELGEAVTTFLDEAGDVLGEDFGSAGVDTDDQTAALAAVAEAIEDASLDADEDADTITALVETAETLDAAVEDSQSWDDLSVREKLRAQGFYEPIEGSKHKDYPPELSAIKGWTKRDNAEMVLLALDMLGDSEQMERMCLDALTRMGNADALDTLTERAARRDVPAIEAIGAIGSEDGVEAIIEYTESDSNPALQTAAIHSLGQIGSESTTQAVADQLVAENESVRSQAARSLGLIGDTRAVSPLADVLADDESDSVRASAAWGLRQIGTESALETAAEYADDRSFLVEEEAQKAADALDTEEAAAA